MDKKEICKICESYMEGVKCEVDCPVEKLFAENKRLEAENSRLKNEMSYMPNPMAIGDRGGEMGW